MRKIELISGQLESNFEKLYLESMTSFDWFASKQHRYLHSICNTGKHDGFARHIEYEFSWLEKKTRIELDCHMEPNKGCGKQRNGKF